MGLTVFYTDQAPTILFSLLRDIPSFAERILADVAGTCLILLATILFVQWTSTSGFLNSPVTYYRLENILKCNIENNIYTVFTKQTQWKH